MDATELPNWLAEAWDDYQSTWAVVDQELYDLCARKSHDHLEDVYAKVAIINRVYMAGITRSVRGTADVDAELRVSRLLLGCRDELSSSLSRLRGNDDLTAESMAAIVTAHGSITQRLARDLEATNLCSFPSKYLHFHYPIVIVPTERLTVPRAIPACARRTAFAVRGAMISSMEAQERRHHGQKEGAQGAGSQPHDRKSQAN